MPVLILLSRFITKSTQSRMEQDSDAEMPSAGPSGGAGKVCEKKRFEVKKWNAVALWAWDIVVDNCAICRNHIMDLCIECQANQVRSHYTSWRQSYKSKSGQRHQ